jgi:Domain of unknown function (DUF4893)
MKITLPLAVTLALLSPASLHAQEELRPADQARLDGYDAAAGDALLRALAEGAPEDVAALTTALSGAPAVAFDPSLAGDWKCRTLKLGGPAGLIAYSPFDCRITLRLDGFDFEKLSGSQRTKGRIIMRNGRAIYVGVGFAAGETPPDYADLPEDFRSDGRIQADVAVVERVSPNRARLLFPAPAVESDFDILELTR